MNNKFLSYLVCPICKKNLKRRSTGLYCAQCETTYPVRNGVPVLVNLESLPEQLQGQIRYFKRSSKLYGTGEIIAPWQRKYSDRLFDQLKIKKNKVLVDNACGSGYVSLDAARQGMYVVACDLNLSGLIELRRYAEKLGLSNRILPVCCTSEALPIKNSVADAIVANAILEHLPNEKAAIDDMTRIAKKGAVAIITVPLAYYLLNPLFLLVNYVHDKQIGHLRRYTKEILAREFQTWSIVRVSYSGHTKKVLKTLLNLLKPWFNEEDIEREDAFQSEHKLFASNISIIFRKK